MRALLQALDAALPYAFGFFASFDPNLRLLTPVEVVMGRAFDARSLDPWQLAVLAASHYERFEAVRSAAIARSNMELSG